MDSAALALVPWAGRGNALDTAGNLLRRVASKGQLNSP